MNKGIRTNRVLAVAAAVALVFGLASAGLVWAQGRGPEAGRMHPRMGMGPGMGGGMMMDRVIRRLDLTPQQKEQIKAILQSNQEQIKTLADQDFSARQKLHQAIVANNPGDIETANTDMSAIQLNMEKLRASIRAQIFGQVLTPEQRTKANSMEEQFEQNMAQWHQREQQRLGNWLQRSKTSNGGGY
jgi:Spy/CpxP family protein refolding chaperone